MRDPERTRRSNRILIILIVLCLLYGILYRMSSGDNSFYLFGFKVFGPEQTVEENANEAVTAAAGLPAEETESK